MRSFNISIKYPYIINSQFGFYQQTCLQYDLKYYILAILLFRGQKLVPRKKFGLYLSIDSKISLLSCILLPLAVTE